VTPQIMTTAPAVQGQGTLFDVDPDIKDLLAAAHPGPPAWKRGLAQHLAKPGTHGKTCFTCYCYARHTYDLEWPCP